MESVLYKNIYCIRPTYYSRDQKRLARMQQDVFGSA